MIWILPAIFVLVHSPSGDTARAYEGQDQATILRFLADEGATGDFVDRATYEAYVLAHKPKPLTPIELNLAQRGEALDELNTDASGNAKVIRAVFLVELDEINLIRSLLSPSQPARTMQQFKTAVQNKINSGSAD